MSEAHWIKSCCDASHHQTKAILQAFVNGVFAAAVPAYTGHPRVWGNGIPIKIAWVLKPRSELRVTPGDTCALVSSASINRASQNPKIYLVWKIYEEKMIWGQEIHFLHIIVDEIYEPFRDEE